MNGVGVKFESWSSQVAANRRTDATNTISTRPSAHRSHSAVMTPQSAELLPRRCRRVPGNQSTFRAAPSVARLSSSDHRLLAAAASISLFFCSVELMCGSQEEEKRDSERRLPSLARSLFLQEGEEGPLCESALKRGKYRGESGEHKRLPGAGFSQTASFFKKKQEGAKGKHFTAPPPASATPEQHVCKKRNELPVVKLQPVSLQSVNVQPVSLQPVNLQLVSLQPVNLQPVSL